MNRVLFLFVLFAASLRADTFEDLSARAKAAREANNIKAAVELYRQGVELNPQWQEGWWFLGTLLYDTDQYAPASDAFQHFVDLNAHAAPGWAFLGLCEFETADYAKALRDIQRGISLGANKQTELAPVLLYHEALLLTREGQFDAALQKYSALLRGMPGNRLTDSMLVSIGLAALRAAQVPKDLAQSEQDLYIRAGKAASFVLMGDYSRADDAFADLLKTYPRTANAHYVHGVYLLARDPDEAFQEFKRELEIVPGNTAADRMLAFGLLTRGDSDEALPYAEKAATAPASIAFDRYLYGRALAETGQTQRGLAYLKEAEKAADADPDVHVALAAAYSRAGEPVEARREREVAMQMESESGRVVQP